MPKCLAAVQETQSCQLDGADINYKVWQIVWNHRSLFLGSMVMEGVNV